MSFLFWGGGWVASTAATLYWFLLTIVASKQWLGVGLGSGENRSRGPTHIMTLCEQKLRTQTMVCSHCRMPCLPLMYLCVRYHSHLDSEWPPVLHAKKPRTGGEGCRKSGDTVCSCCRGKPKDLAWAEYSDSRRCKASGDKCADCASLWKAAFIYLTWPEYCKLATNQDHGCGDECMNVGVMS